jgi:hypothetical protein
MFKTRTSRMRHFVHCAMLRLFLRCSWLAGRETNVSMNCSHHKFKFLKQMVDEQRLSILAMQETHLEDTSAGEFHTVYHSWFKISTLQTPIMPLPPLALHSYLTKNLRMLSTSKRSNGTWVSPND